MTVTHNFTLDTFRKAHEDMVAKTDISWSRLYSNESTVRYREYTLEEIEQIINSSSLSEQQKLSRTYFYKDGFYKRIILHYATNYFFFLS